MAKQDHSASVPDKLPTWKRVLDLSVLVGLAPALLLVGGGVALLVACGSRGPIFFRQRRVGLKGREFMLFKFRTMHVDSETTSHENYFKHLMESDKPMTKLDARRDPRLVPLGALLRATGLDELPQLLNVLRGDMSIVGPRPPLPREVRLYETPQLARLKGKPGITGLWQVSGRSDLTFAQMVELDRSYLEHWSLGLDLHIMLRTALAIVRRRGAY